jgi:hypothetical protein
MPIELEIANGSSVAAAEQGNSGKSTFFLDRTPSQQRYGESYLHICSNSHRLGHIFSYKL